MTLFKRYRGDPSPLPTQAEVPGLQRAEPTDYPPPTSSSGTGHPIPSFVPTTNVPIVGTANPARSFLALMPIMFGFVQTPQAGGARRLFPTNKIGAYNQSPTPQAVPSQRIVRPTAGPWDRGGAVGGG